MTSRTIIVGDLHGMYDEAKLLLKKCSVGSNDRVIFLGDLVDRGPDSIGCVELAMHYERTQGKPACILGNHEEKHLKYNDIKLKKGHVDVHVPDHVRTRSQLDQRHYDYFGTMPTFIRLPKFNTVCVHAGVWPERTIEQQTLNHLLHVQTIKPYDDRGNSLNGRDSERSYWPSKAPNNAGWGFWTKFWKGPERIVFGHSVLNKPLVTDLVVGLDGGGCFGLELWALVLPDNEIVKQSCGNAQRDRRLWLIDGDVGTY